MTYANWAKQWLLTENTQNWHPNNTHKLKAKLMKTVFALGEARTHNLRMAYRKLPSTAYKYGALTDCATRARRQSRVLKPYRFSISNWLMQCQSDGWFLLNLKTWITHWYCHFSLKITSSLFKWTPKQPRMALFNLLGNGYRKCILAERSFDLRTSGLWAQHASTAPLCSTAARSVNNCIWLLWFEQHQWFWLKS